MSVIELDFYAEDAPNGSLLGTLTDEDFTGRGESLEIRPALHELGEIKLTVSRHNTAATSTLIRENNFVKVRIPSVSTDPLCTFVLKEGEFVLIDEKEQGGELLTFKGPGVVYMLSFARLHFTPYAPAQPERGSVSEFGVWKWINEPYGAILTRIIEEGQNQPGSPLADVTIDFNRVNDSDGNAWPTITEEFQTPIGSDVLTVASRLSVAGDLYLVMDPDLTLHAYQTYGRDLTGAFGSSTVRFEKGVNILTQLRREIKAREMLTHLIQEDSDGAYSLEVMPGFAGRAHYGYFEAGQTNDDTQLNKIAQNVIAASRTSGQAHELEIAPGFDPANGLYMPGQDGTNGHFWVGDHVTLHTGTGGHDFNAAEQIMVAMRIVLDEASDDSTSDTAARSLHIVPELNYQEVRGFTGVSPAALGVPGFCCGPDPAVPGTPGTVTPPTIDYTWPFTSDKYDVEEHAHEWQGAVTYLNPTIRWIWTGTAHVDVLPSTSPAHGRSVTPGTNYELLVNVDSRSGSGTRRLEWSWYGSSNNGISTTVLSADLGVGHHVFAPPTAPSGAEGFRIQCVSQGGADLFVSYVAVRHGGGITAGTPGDGHPDLIGDCANKYVGPCFTDKLTRDRPPTVDDDETQGIPVGTVWTQVNDTGTPTQIVGQWVIVTNSSGAAQWLQLPTQGAVDTLTGRVDLLEAGGASNVTLASVSTMHRFPVWGHRGDIGSVDKKPENTLESVRQAALKGAQGAEIDVRLTSDSVFVLMHDTTVDRTTSGSGSVSGMTAATFTALTIDAGYGFISGTYHPPTLEAVFDALNPYDFVLSIQLNASSDANATALAQFVVAQGWTHRCLIEVSTLSEAEAIKDVSAALTVEVNNTVSGADSDDNVDWLSMERATITSLAVTTGKAPKHVKSYITISDFPADETPIIQNMWDRGVSAYQTDNLDFALIQQRRLLYGGSSGQRASARWEPAVLDPSASSPELAFTSDGDIAMLWVE